MSPLPSGQCRQRQNQRRAREEPRERRPQLELPPQVRRAQVRRQQQRVRWPSKPTGRRPVNGVPAGINDARLLSGDAACVSRSAGLVAGAAAVLIGAAAAGSPGGVCGSVIDAVAVCGGVAGCGVAAGVAAVFSSDVKPCMSCVRRRRIGRELLDERKTRHAGGRGGCRRLGGSGAAQRYRGRDGSRSGNHRGREQFSGDVHGSPIQVCRHALARSYGVTAVTQVTRVAFIQPLRMRRETVTGR